MATAQFDFPIANVNGAVVKHGVISRQKHFRSPDGKIIKKGKKEMYKVANPRDFSKTPQHPKEKNNRNLFKQASEQAMLIFRYADPTSNPTPEQQAELETWQNRFTNQLPGIRGNHADPDAPVDKTTGRAKRYVQFKGFLMAMFRKQLADAAVQQNAN
jgi:hypothetical protein